MRISYCTWSAVSLPIERVIPMAAEIGYHGIELAVTPRFQSELYGLDAARRSQIRQMLSDHGLVLSAVAGHTSVSETDPDRNAANLQRLRDTIDLAAELRSPGEPAIVASHLSGNEDDWGKLKETIAERVYALGEHAASRDAIFAVEPHCGTVLDLPRKVVWLMERVNHPSVKVNFDMSHFVIRGMPLDDYVPQLVPYSVHTHVKDQRGVYPRHEFMTPGSGPFDYVEYLRAMHEAGYGGWIGMEVSMMVQEKPGYDPATDANLGYWALVHGFRMSGVPLVPRNR